ncbi:MAG: hypothetical protein ACUVR4_01605 [Anaerolineae bacterium]
MGPVELVFLTIFVIFGIIGMVRGYGRELGVTTMLFITLFVLEFLAERYPTVLLQVIAIFTGPDQEAQIAAGALIYCAALLVITFISYEGETLSFPGKRGKIIFDLGSGLLNGYLLAGSLWYYLQAANWPILRPSGDFTALYRVLVRFLPPAVFSWQYLIGLAVIMLIARIWK